MNISKLSTILPGVNRASIESKIESASTQKSANSGKKLPDPGQSSVVTQNARPDIKELRGAIEQANSAPVVRSSNLKFTVAEGTDINIVRVEDSETGELIRQIPSEAMVAIAQALNEQMHGSMLQEQV